MSDFMNVIKERRSVRKYTDEPVPEEMVEQILESVQWAQSWTNNQCWEIVRVEDETLRQELQETMSKGNPATKGIVNAPLLLAVCGKLGSSGYYKEMAATKFGDWFMFDLGIATQNICLTAHSLGLGAVVAGLFDHDKAKEHLKLPEGYEVVTLIPIGFPAKTPSAPKRKEISEFTHLNTFGSK